VAAFLTEVIGEILVSIRIVQGEGGGKESAAVHERVGWLALKLGEEYNFFSGIIVESFYNDALWGGRRH